MGKEIKAAPPSRDGRARGAALLLLGLGALLVFVLWPRKAPRPAKSAVDDAEANLSPPPAPYTLRPPPAAEPSAPEPEPGPVIDGIDVEKKEVCEGEENLITIHAHTTNGTDSSLHYVIDGKPGQAVPVVLLTEHGHVMGQHFVSVFGRNNAVTTVEVPKYKVKDCRPTYLALVSAGLQPNTWADYNIAATIAAFPHRPDMAVPAAPPKPFGAVHYNWSFGDGETATTDVPAVSHSYERRKQDGTYSYMVVAMEAVNAAGEKVSARTSLALLNPAFESLQQKGAIQLLVALDPRFPELDEQKRVVQKVRLTHISPTPVTIESATLTKYFVGGSGEPERSSVDVAKLLGGREIPPGPDGLTLTVVLDTAADRDVFSANYDLTGKSAAGQPVAGTFSVMLPPERPTAENSKVISDPILTAKIIAAREILKKDVVNEGEIAELEREGRFSNLGPPGGTAQQDPGPPPALRAAPHAGPGSVAAASDGTPGGNPGGTPKEEAQ